jgi:hypothetical protein
MTMKPFPQKARSLARRRSRARGAALVEAAVVIPSMLVFLGLTMWVHDSYDEKLASQTSTRAQVLYYASHNCTEEVPTELETQLGTRTRGAAPSSSTQDSDTTEGSGGDADHAASKLGGEEQEGLKRSWNLVKTHRDTTVSGSGSLDKQRFTMSIPVTSNSEVACNEKRYDSSWTAVFGFIGGFLRSGGGIVD